MHQPPCVDTAIVDRLRRAGCVYADDESALLAATFPDPAALGGAVARREAGDLLEHIVGSSRFCGEVIRLAPGVFVPRSRAAPLARAAVDEAARRGVGARVLDLGCGSGAIAAAIARAVPTANVVATDVATAAVESARRNGERFGFTVRHGDWFDGLDRHLLGRLDVVVAYLPHTPGRALVHLPRDRIIAEGLASFAGGRDGLDHLRTVVTALPRWLAPDGVLLTLVAAEQAEGGTEVAVRAGWACSTQPTSDDDCLLAVTRSATSSR